MTWCSVFACAFPVDTRTGPAGALNQTFLVHPANLRRHLGAGRFRLGSSELFGLLRHPSTLTPLPAPPEIPGVPHHVRFHPHELHHRLQQPDVFHLNRNQPQGGRRHVDVETSPLTGDSLEHSREFPRFESVPDEFPRGSLNKCLSFATTVVRFAMSIPFRKSNR